MKALLLIAALLAVPAVGPTITQADRDKAVTELEGSQKMFLDATRGLSEAQWNFKPARTAGRWQNARNILV